MIFLTGRHSNQAEAQSTIISLRCPACHKQGTFDPIESVKDIAIQKLEGGAYFYYGQRRCPDSACGAHLFFVYDQNTKQILASYPPERLDFDSTNVPANVTHALEEAITCHANECYIAAAIMVRKTLEELCVDRQAAGKNLKERIKQLGSKVVLPQDLLEGLDDLRLLGNDAAHIESQEFNQIGKEEVEIGIEVTKEILKATYQYTALLTRLRSLKK